MRLTAPLSRFEFNMGHVRKLPVTRGQALVSQGSLSSSILHNPVFTTYRKLQCGRKSDDK